MAVRYADLFMALSLVLVTGVACIPRDTDHSLTLPSSLSVVSVDPAFADAGSIADVVVRGMGFQAGATVTMDGIAAATTFVSSTALSVRVPLHAAGFVDVVVTNPGGQDARLAAGFAYRQPIVLTVRLLSPSSGLLYGDMTNITGTGFQSGAKVTFDGVQAVTANMTSANIRVFPSRHSAGPVDVVVTNPDGQSVTVNSGYTYQDVTLSVSATQVAPGGPLTISWTVPAGRAPVDFVGLLRVNDLETLLWSAATNGAATGSRTLAAPVQPGQYVFAYLVEGDLIAVQSEIVTVAAEFDTRPRSSVPAADLQSLLRGRLRSH